MNTPGKGTKADQSDYVILVDKNNTVLGTAPKLVTHSQNTPLHRAFSVFIFNRKGELLLQQRSSQKKTWPLIWSNSCCGHHQLEESNEQAATRRVVYELGLSISEYHTILPTYTYRYEYLGVVEHEYCPVMIAFTEDLPNPRTDEVEAVKWVAWEEFLQTITTYPGTYSPWSEEEAYLLAENDSFQALYKNYQKD